MNMELRKQTSAVEEKFRRDTLTPPDVLFNIMHGARFQVIEIFVFYEVVYRVKSFALCWIIMIIPLKSINNPPFTARNAPMLFPSVMPNNNAAIIRAGGLA